MEPISIGCQVVKLGEDTVSVGDGTYTRAEVRRFLKGEPMPCRWCSDPAGCGFTFRLLSNIVIEKGRWVTGSRRVLKGLDALKKWAAKRSKR